MTNPTQHQLSNLAIHTLHRQALEAEPLPTDKRWEMRYLTRVYDMLDRGALDFATRVREVAQLSLQLTKE